MDMMYKADKADKADKIDDIVILNYVWIYNYIKTEIFDNGLIEYNGMLCRAMFSLVDNLIILLASNVSVDNNYYNMGIIL